jgi:membrane dipeptidase
MNPWIIDMHFDLLMDLYEKRHRTGVLGQDFWEELSTGNIGVAGVAIYLENRYLPEMGLRVALDQIARLYEEVAQDNRFAICKSYGEIVAARAANKIVFVITMEGVEPLGNDPDLLRAFYELGVRSIGLTHVRRNMAGDGGVFAPTGSSPQGLTAFGKHIIRQCEALGILVDLAHLNPAGVDDVLNIATKPLILSHTNARKYYDIERNSTDAHMKAVAERGGVIGVNAVLVSGQKAMTTLDHYVDHIEHIVALVGIDHVGIGFDFFEFIYKNMAPAEKAAINKLAEVYFIPELANHGHAPNLAPKLMARGFTNDDIEKIYWRNFMRVFEAVLR